jgi:hypothetical protein
MAYIKDEAGKELIQCEGGCGTTSPPGENDHHGLPNGWFEGDFMRMTSDGSGAETAEIYAACSFPCLVLAVAKLDWHHSGYDLMLEAGVLD